MKKALLAAIFVVVAGISSSAISYAGNFSVLASTGILNLANNQAWEKSYKTDKGNFKIRFRKLWNASEQKKYHLIIWWDDKRIADGYCPKLSSGYSFNIFREETSGRIFVSLETYPRIVLMGYEPKNGRLEKYIDSKNYSTISNPKLLVDVDKDLLLAFLGKGQTNPLSYKFFWDESKRWFGFKDVTVRPPAPAEVQEMQTPEPEKPSDGYNYDYRGGYSEPDYSETASSDYEGELYYEESVVVGS